MEVKRKKCSLVVSFCIITCLNSDSVISISRGLMSVKGGNECRMDGIVAHVSSLACPKVHETASSLKGRLSAEILPRLEVWPKTFLKNGGPKDESVALFFFPSSERYT